MNTRVLELLKTPKNIQSEDLLLLKQEIQAFPYIQNIRALHLYGVHLYDQENYQKELSITAAYTTDKKILYQLINGKIQEHPKPELIVDTTIENIDSNNIVKEEIAVSETEEPVLLASSKHDYEAIAENLIEKIPEEKLVFVNGERNRILFEGEEDFLNDTNNATIDLESTLESGTIVTLKHQVTIADISSEETSSPTDLEEKINSIETEIPEVTNIETEAPQIENEIASELPEKGDDSQIEIEAIHNPEPKNDDNLNQLLSNDELIVDEENINSIEVSNKVDDAAELSFHGTDSFLPEVKIESHATENVTHEKPIQSTINKHEDEMRKLIEEVEKKMKAKKLVEEKPEVAEPDENSQDVNFSETQSFELQKDEVLNLEIIETEQETSEIEVRELEEEAKVDEAKVETISTWKPMSFDTHIPDSAISKSSTSFPIPRAEEKKEVKESIAVEIPTIVEENKVTALEIPVVEAQPIIETPEIAKPVSKSIEEKKIPTIIKEESLPTSNSTVVDDSNVPGFINTWQSWLKIDRIEEIEEDLTEKKNKVIESFIENSPKISQLKDEVNFVVKEKNDDISHLMTETLAKLYMDQKLYAKAIKAYQTLSIKHPERKEYFEGKVKEVKDNKTKN